MAEKRKITRFVNNREANKEAEPNQANVHRDSVNDESESQKDGGGNSADNSKKRKFEPKFQSSWMKMYSWIKLNDNSEMVCELCVKSSKSNPFTSGCTNFRTSRHLHYLETAI